MGRQEEIQFSVINSREAGVLPPEQASLLGSFRSSPPRALKMKFSPCPPQGARHSPERVILWKMAKLCSLGLYIKQTDLSSVSIFLGHSWH